MATDHATAPGPDSASMLESARRALRTERRRLEDERAAFERFRARVDRLETTAPGPTDAGALGSVPPRGVDPVREAYAETVMNVPHYRDVYDESFDEHLGNELGEALAAALTRDRWLSPHVKRALVRTADAAVESRERLVERFDAEREDLEAVAEALEECRAELESLLAQPVDRMGFNALRLTRVRLHGLADRCEELAARRQAFVRRRRRSLPGRPEEFGSYAYAECDVDYPALAAVATFADRVDRARRTIERELATVA